MKSPTLTNPQSNQSYQFSIFLADIEVYLKSKIVELQKEHADEGCSEHGDYYVGDGLYSSTGRKSIYNQMEPISKRKSMANDSKASVYFTPTESIDHQSTQLQLSPIHINYIRENMDAYVGCARPTAASARKLFFQQRQMHSADDEVIDPMTFGSLKAHSNGFANTIADDNDESDTESTIMIATAENDSSNEDNCAARSRNDYIPMNILCRNATKHRCDSKDMYYSLENVFDAHPSNAINERSQHRPLTNDLTVGESSDVQTSNSSASDNCIVDDEQQNTDWTNGKVTPEKEISSGANGRYGYRVDSDPNFNELYPSSSLPIISRTISASAEVHCSEDSNESHISLDIELPSKPKTAELNAVNQCNGIIESA